MLRGYLIVAWAVLWVASPGVAFAQRVLLARPPSSDTALSDAFNRLGAELQLQDFEVEVLDTGSRRLSPGDLQAEAQQRDAFAGIALSRDGSGANADISIVDRITGKITLRRLVFAGEDSPRVLAVRAVDLLRASLRELPEGERPPPEVIGVTRAPAPPALRAFAEDAPHFQVGAAAAVLTSTSDISSGYGGALAFWYRPVHRFGVGASLVGPLVGARFRARTGSATLRQEMGQLRATFGLVAPGRFAVGPVLGAGVYHLQAQGEVFPPLNGETSAVWSFAGSAGVESSFKLTRVLSLSGSLQGILLTPRPVVAIDAELEELGQPLLLAALGLELSF